MKKILYLLIFFGLLSIVWADTPWKYGQCIYNNTTSSHVKADESIMESENYTTSGYLFDTSLSERLICKTLENAFYKINYNSNYGTNSTKQSYNLDYGVSYTLPKDVFTRTGYTFSHWNDKNKQSYPTSIIGLCDSQGCEIDLYAQWSANTNTKYVVNHYIQNLAGTGYGLNGTDNKTGTSDSSLTLANLKKSINGFTYSYGQVDGSTVTTTTIAADGSRVINLYYTRNSYKVTLNKGTGISSVSGAGTYKYGASVTIDATASSGYTWSKWSGTHSTTTKKIYIYNASR